MTRSAIAIAAFFCAASLASAQELLISGHVESILLLPSGSANCPNLSGSTKAAAASQHIALSNDGGCQQATIHVSRTLLGKPQPQTITIATRIGEWGQPSLPLQASDILIDADAGAVRWSALEQKNGAVFFEAKPFKSIGGVTIASLPHDDDGLIPLAILVDQLKPAAH